MSSQVTIIGPTTAEFSKSLALLEAAATRGFVDPKFGTLPVQARLLAETAMKLTPPKSVGVGNRAVERAMRIRTRPLQAKSFKNENIKKIIQSGDREAWNVVSPRFKQTNRLHNSEAMEYSPRLYERSYKPTRRIVLLQDQLRAFRAGLKERKTSVGSAKGAWVRTILALGGKAPSRWISRHQNKDAVFYDGTANPSTPQIRFGNTSSWARRNPKSESIAKRALQIRAESMRKYAFKMAEVASAQATRQMRNVLNVVRALG